jgi:hypothetical protein
MAGIRRLVERIALEFEPHRSPEADGDPLPRLERVAGGTRQRDGGRRVARSRGR